VQGGDRVQPAQSGAARSYNKSGSGQICGLFAVDIATFAESRRDDDIQLYMHESLYEMLETAFAQSEVPWTECAHEDRGDGVLVVSEPAIPPGRLLLIPDRLRILIRRHNRLSCDAAHIQLRIAIHLGPVHHDGHGMIGGDVNLLFRLLDARQLKQQLAASSAEIALITSDYFYTNLVCRQPSMLDPSLFNPVNIRVKETRARAWVYLPETPQRT
jgi:class 3 adenylate cyclase